MATAQATAQAAQAQAVVAAANDAEQKRLRLQQHVKKVRVRQVHGGGYANVSGGFIKLPVGYYQMSGGGDPQFPYSDFYLDFRGNQIDTSVAPLDECHWGGCERQFHWSINCKSVGKHERKVPPSLTTEPPGGGCSLPSRR